jgi:hypothetical protein
MHYAVALEVKLMGSLDEGMQMLNDIVIPNAKAQTGFQKGLWLRSAPSAGLGIVVFDTEENATAALPNLTPPPGGPELLSSRVYGVTGEA